jgi:hypothetical protein
MKRVWTVLLLVLLVSAALAVPAAAAKPDKPGKPSPVYYEVTMSLNGDSDGLATTCESGPIKMLFDSAHNRLIATGEDGTEVARLFVRLSIPWHREHPYWLGQEGDGFAECHGGQTPESRGEWGGALGIIVDTAGSPTGILWHFDHYVTTETVVRPNGRVTTSTSLIEAFTLSSDAFSYDAETQIATGTFALYRWGPDLTPDTYEWQGESDFSFTLEL